LLDAVFQFVHAVLCFLSLRDGLPAAGLCALELSL
jgi:hypothetical protein